MIPLANDILFVASILTALGVIITTAIKIYKFIRKWEVWVEEQREHSVDDELAILRQRDSKPEELAEYFDFVESIKQSLKENEITEEEAEKLQEQGGDSLGE